MRRVNVPRLDLTVLVRSSTQLRLMSSKRLPTKPRGLEGDAQLLESLLFSKSSSSTLEEDDPAIGVAPRLGGTGGKTSRAPRQR